MAIKNETAMSRRERRFYEVWEERQKQKLAKQKEREQNEQSPVTDRT